MNFEERFPCCKTFMCLLQRKPLAEGIMPKWFTKLVNWAIKE